MKIKFKKDALPFRAGDIIDIDANLAKNHLRVNEAELATEKDKATAVIEIIEREKAVKAKEAQALKEKAEALQD